MNPFTRHHTLHILNAFESITLPLDAFLSFYFRKNKAIGSTDRKTICKTIYGIIRWKALIDYYCKSPITWESRVNLFPEFVPENYEHDQSIPLHIRMSFPKPYFKFLEDSIGTKLAIDFCIASNTQAPTTVRINPIQTTRKALFDLWKDIYPVQLCEESKLGITFQKRINFFALPEFKAGKFEIQDEGSQLVANHLEIKPSDHILDYCAGSGGKTLAFAYLTQNRGQIYLYDIRPRILKEAQKRLKRACIQNAQVINKKTLKSKLLINKMNWILLDVPCSGSGTMRRNPDMKWKFDLKSIEELVSKQREIFEKSLKYLHSSGRIVYATCSVFPQENEEQIQFFIEKYNLELTKPPFSSFPQRGKMDGFFTAVLKRKIC